MIVNNDKIRFSASDLVLVLISVLFAVGIRIWFPVCEPKSDGSFMSCHWAGETLKAISVVLIVLCCCHAFFAPSGKTKIGMDYSLSALCAMTFAIPGRIISLCKMDEMNCQANTKLWTVIFMAVMLAALIIDIIVYMTFESNQKHKRKTAEE